MSERAFLTPEEVSDRLGFPPESVYEALESGELPAIKLGPSYRIPEDELDEWIHRQLGGETNGADFQILALENENVPDLPDTPKPGIQEPQRQVGVATRYSPHRGKGFGFITAEDGRDVFLRGSEARDLEIETGDVVEFVTVPGRPYPVARKVRLVEKSRFKQHPDAEKLYKDALDAQQLGYSERARRLFIEAINKGAFLLIFTTFVEMERKLNRPQHALGVVRQGIEVFPRVGKLYYIGAELLLQTKKREEALALLRAGIEQAPSFYNNHRLYIEILMSKATPHSLRIAIEHSRRLDKHMVPHASLDDPLLCFLRGPELPHDAYRFFQKAGFSIAIKQTCGQYVDFFVTSSETEYVDTYGLYQKVWVRCFSGSDYGWEDIHAFFEAWQDFGANEKTLNLDVSFAVMRDAAPLRHIFYRILTDSKSAIVPLDVVILESDKPTATFREQLDSWLSRRDLYRENFPVSGRQFFGREVEIQGLLRSISEGRNAGVFGLRKVGKTSVLYQLRDKSKQDIVAYVDLQSVPAGVHGTAYLYWNIAHEVYEQFRKKYPEICEDMKLRLGSTSSYDDIHQPEKRNAVMFDKELKMIMRRLSSAAPEARVVVLIDELERMLPTGGNPGFPSFSDFFAHIRGIAQQESGKLVSVVAAANPLISERAKWNSMDNPVFRYYEEIYLPLLAESECREMITELGRRMGVAYLPGSLDFIYAQTGGHPFLVRRLCSHVLSRHEQRPIEITDEIVNGAIETFLLAEGSTFREILDRLKHDFPLEYDLLLFIVSGVHRKRDLSGLVDEPIDEALRHLLGYQLIWQQGDTYAVKIELLSSWLRSEGIA